MAIHMTCIVTRSAFPLSFACCCLLPPFLLILFFPLPLSIPQATKEAQLIFGFFALKNTFADSAEFVTENNGVNNQPATPCPPELEALQGRCAVHEGLRAIMDRHDFADHKKKGGPSPVQRSDDLLVCLTIMHSMSVMCLTLFV